MQLALRRNGDILPTVTLNTNDFNIDWSKASTFSKIISANPTFSFTNNTDGQVVVFRIINSSASLLTLAWPASVVNPDLTIAASKTKVVTLIQIGSQVYSSSVDI